MRSLVAVLAGFAAVYLVVIPVLERIVPRSWLRAYWKVMNPLWMPLAGNGLGFGIVETTGLKSGKKHQVPVGGRLQKNSFWFVAGTGYKSDYVKNIQADPRVRVKVHRRWREGVAHLMPEDDARRRLLKLNPLNSAFLAIAGTDLVTVRIDLEPSPRRRR